MRHEPIYSDDENPLFVGWAVPKRRSAMRIPIRTVSGAVPPTKRPLYPVDGQLTVDVWDLTDLWKLKAEIDSYIAIATDPSTGQLILLVIDDYLD